MTAPTTNSAVSGPSAGHRTETFGGRAASCGGIAAWATVGGVASSVATVAGMIATPLLPQGGRGRRLLSSVVVGGMFATTTFNAARRWGAGRAAGAATITAVATAIVERIGTRTGLPFGRYGYTDALRPQVAHVPVIVPLAWFGMGLPSREAATAALGPGSTAPGRVALGAAAMTAWDLFLDPQMTGEGYWRWARRGIYRGIPLSNYLGWFLTGLGIMALFEMLLPPGDDSASDDTADVVPTGVEPVGANAVLVGEYAYMAVMQTLGFARFFRDPLVAAVGGAAMLPIAGVAAARVVGRAR